MDGEGGSPSPTRPACWARSQPPLLGSGWRWNSLVWLTPSNATAQTQETGERGRAQEEWPLEHSYNRGKADPAGWHHPALKVPACPTLAGLPPVLLAFRPHPPAHILPQPGVFLSQTFADAPLHLKGTSADPLEQPLDAAPAGPQPKLAAQTIEFMCVVCTPPTPLSPLRAGPCTPTPRVWSSAQPFAGTGPLFVE